MWRKLKLAGVVAVLIAPTIQWWVASRPEATVFYSEKTRSIPTGRDPDTQSFTEITLWNSSRRTPAKDLSVSIALEFAAGLARVGSIETQEPESSYDWKVT